MSAGVDSHSALFASLEAGAKPVIYSFRMEGVLSRDFKMAQKTAQHFDLPFNEIILPDELDTLIRDVRQLAKFGARSKTDFECFWPMRYMIPRIKEKVMFTGHGADSLYCLSRKACQHFKGREDEFRTQAFANKRAFQRHLIVKMCKRYDIKYVPSFYCDPVLKIFQGTTPADINKPIQKAVSRFAFAEYFEQVKVYTHTSFQLGDSGISSHFETLLDSELNPGRRYKSVRGVYNHVLNSMGLSLSSEDDE
jgi:asparagine synthetase B (glutamine-hydrolysing)